MKALYIIASNGTEVIDERPEAEIVAANRRYAEERYEREQKREKVKKHLFSHVISSCR